MTPAVVSRLVIDTDFGQYCEDATAVAIAHYMSAEMETVGFIIPNTNIYAPGALDAVNTYYNRGALLIANYKGNPLFPGPDYAQPLDEDFANDLDAASALDPNDLYRSLLQASPDKGTNIAIIGHQTTFYEFLLQADGPALVEQKVNEVIIMGGWFPSGIEGNIVRDMVAADYVAQNCPVPIVYCGWEVGTSIINGAGLSTLTPITNPVRKKYELQMGIGVGQSSWDEMTVLYAIRGLTYGEDTYYTRIRGTATFSTVNGNCTWVDNPLGNHYYLVKAQDDNFYVDLLGTMVYWIPT